MAKELDCTTSIESTQNNGIHGIHFDLHTAFSRLNCLASKQNTWVDQHLRRGQHNFKIESFQSADVLRKLLSELDFKLGDDGLIEDNSHIFGTLYYRDIFKCIQYFLAHLPCQGHLHFEPVDLADPEGHWIYSEMSTSHWRWDTQDQPPARVTIVPVICASDKTHLTNFSGDQHAWPLYLTIGNS